MSGIWPLPSRGLLWNWFITWKIIKNWNLKLLIPFRILMTAPCATFRIKIARLNLKLFHSNLPVSKIIVYIKWYWTCFELIHFYLNRISFRSCWTLKLKATFSNVVSSKCNLRPAFSCQSLVLECSFSSFATTDFRFPGLNFKKNGFIYGPNFPGVI